jgi:lipopolysaccharide export system protein LptC
MTLTLEMPRLPGRRDSATATRDAAAFQAARRHSRVVSLLRKAIPIGSALAFALLVLAPILNPFSGIGGLSLGPISLSGSKVTMEKPRLTGFRKDNRPYEVTAVSATQDIRKPNSVELNLMNARVETESGGWVRLESKSGTFDSQKEQMQLNEQIRVATDAGYEAFLKTADIDFKAGTIRSKDPVAVNMGAIRITADTLDVSDNGKIIVFQGRVNTLIDNSEQEGGDQPKPAEKKQPVRPKATPNPDVSASGASSQIPVGNPAPTSVRPLPATAASVPVDAPKAGVTTVDPRGRIVAPERKTP